MKRSVASFICFFMLIQTSFAQNKPNIIVSPLKGKNTKPAMDAISSELRKSGQVYVVDFEKVMEYMKSKNQKKEKKSTKDAVAAFEKGKKAYQNLNIKEAIEAFEKSKKLYQDALSDESSFQGLRSTKFNLAMAYLADKKDAQAKLELQEMVLIDPHHDKSKPSEKYYSPQIRDLYQKVLKEVGQSEKGTIHIASTPPGANVFMDGASQGVTPLDVHDVPAGRHYFRFILDQAGQDEFIEKFIVKDANEIEMAFSDTAGRDVTSFFQTTGVQKELDQSRATFLDEMGLALGADLFLLLTPLQGKVKGQLYDQRSQELSQEVAEPNPQALVSKLLRYLGPDGYVVPSEQKAPDETQSDNVPVRTPPPANGNSVGVDLKPRPSGSKPHQSSQDIDYTQPKVQAPKGPSTPWYKNKWVWIVVGAGVIGGGVLLYTSGAINFDPSASTVKATIP